MTMKAWKLTAGSLALTAVLAGALPVQAQAPAPIKIGASMSLTGTYAKPGSYQKEGYDICVEEVNAKGGLLGRKIEFVVYDDQSMPATAVKLYEKLITEDKVDAVMGPYSSAVSEAVANVTEKYKKVMVAPLAATTSIFKKGRKYIFMVVSPAEVYLEGLADMAAKRGLKTVAIVNEDTLFPKASVAGFAEQAKKRGMQVVLQEAYPKGNTDFSALLVKIKSREPRRHRGGDLLRRCGGDHAPDEGAERQSQDVRAHRRRRSAGVPRPAQAERGLRLRGDPVGRHAAYPGQKEFLAAYTKRFKHEPSYHAAAGYGGCLVYVEAAKRAGTLDSDKVRDELLKLKMKTAFGDYAVDQDGFQTAHKAVMLQWQDGKRMIVWPEELANAKPRYPTPPWNQR